jgi:hypothetical protein
MHIIFNGPPGSGKDEACSFLKTNYGFKHLQFKDQLFLETASHFNVSLDWFMSSYNDRKIKEKPEAELNGLSRRQALIHVSEDIIKPKFGKDYFGVKTSEKIDLVSSYCFSDGGFVEEVLPVINTVGHENICIVQLIRNGSSFSFDSRNYIHGHLQDVFGLPLFVNQNTLVELEPEIPIRMYVIYNNTSVSDFHQAIIKILGREVNAKKSKFLFRKSL